MNRLHGWYCSSDRWAKRLQGAVVPWVLGERSLGADALEVGPGPGLTTDVLASRAERLTWIEVDETLASRLEQRLAGGNVTVVPGDATAMPFEDGRFSAAVSFTMLHHVPSAELQDRLFAEVRRVLAPGALFLGSDSKSSRMFSVFHLFDTCVTVDPATLPARLEHAGFVEAAVREADSAFKFRARRP